MVEIKNIVFTNYKFDDRRNPFMCFLCFINYLLPLRLKFLNESFIALKNNQPMGMITLSKDSNSFTRFKITKLILEDETILTASRLVNYVITRYRAMGANSFYVVCDVKRNDLAQIFKNELSFRNCAFEYLYKIENIDESRVSNCSFFLKPFKNENVNEVCKFYNENINSYNRFLFSREIYQFFNGYPKFVFYNDKDNKILGYFEILTNNNMDYYINFSIDCAYNIYLIDAVKFIYMKLKQKNKKFNLYIKTKDYFMNSKEILAILKENKYEFISKSQIFAKDYLREVKDRNLFKNTKIIFSDPTTA